MRDAKALVLEALTRALGTAVSTVRLEVVQSPKKKSEYSNVLKQLTGAFGKENVIEIDD